MTDKSIGLYVHIPFCNKKCAYCDFYSVFPFGEAVNRYTAALCDEIKRWGGELKNRPIDTIYIGGGTPSLLGGRIGCVLDAVYENFAVRENAEITAEANPENIDFLRYARAAGINRLSVGAQTFCDSRLKKIGRNHTAQDTRDFVTAARDLGFDNISLDIMLGLPDSDIKTLAFDIDECLKLSPEHISAYILKKEPNTAFSKLNIKTPDDDGAAEQYMYLCESLEKSGYSHYEISNFARENRESRHNLKYWNTEEYLGVGPAAHSFVDGKRFYYPRDIKAFMQNPATVPDGTGGDPAERAMLGLRLKKGINIEEILGAVPQDKRQKIELYKKAGFLCGSYPQISLTDKGMLLQNSIITELIL